MLQIARRIRLREYSFSKHTKFAFLEKNTWIFPKKSMKSLQIAKGSKNEKECVRKK